MNLNTITVIKSGKFRNFAYSCDMLNDSLNLLTFTYKFGFEGDTFVVRQGELLLLLQIHKISTELCRVKLTISKYASSAYLNAQCSHACSINF